MSLAGGRVIRLAIAVSLAIQGTIAIVGTLSGGYFGAPVPYGDSGGITFDLLGGSFDFVWPIFLLDVTLEDGTLSVRFDGLKKVPGSSKLGEVLYAPVIFHEGRKVGREQKLLLEVLEPAAEGWVKVRHRDGQQGYIRTAHVWGA